MPAWRLTADCIWRSFRASGKRHLFLTGRKGSGKTTLLRKLGADSLPGIATWAVPEKGVWMRETGSDEASQIGLYDPSARGTDGRMRPVAAGFDQLGIPALKRCLSSESEWVSIDEIGYLETSQTEYRRLLNQIMSEKRVAAVIRKQDSPFLSELLGREDAFVIDLDRPFGNVGCVVMASGMGRRFGGNKLMADFCGEPMIARCLAATADAPRRAVVTRHADVAAYCRERGVPVVLHEMPFRSDVVRLGLEALEGVDACMFCPADQPLLSQCSVNALMLARLTAPEKIWRTAFENEPGAPVLFPGWTFPELRALPEGKGGGYVAKKYPEQVSMLPVRDRWELMDADTPEELEKLIRAQKM